MKRLARHFTSLFVLQTLVLPAHATYTYTQEIQPPNQAPSQVERAQTAINSVAQKPVTSGQ